jgi:hypothetical protein
MFTEEEKKMLLSLLNIAQISGTREQIKKIMEKMDVLARKIEAMPTTPVEISSSLDDNNKKEI